MNLYLLSILNSINNTALVATLLTLISCIARAMMAYEVAYNGPGGVQDSRVAGNKASLAVIRPHALVIVGLLLVNLITPSRKDLTEAYIMMEGRKVATAEGLTAAVQKLADIAEKAVEK